MKKPKYETCDLMHGNVCVSKPCICKGMSISKKRGGKRKGAGRKPGKVKEQTKPIRVPLSMIDKVREFVKLNK